MKQRVFRTRAFTRWMSKAGISDALLVHAVSEMEHGLIDADSGGGIVKKRIALPGKGKRGSARTIVATRRSGRWFFLLGFAKNEKDNISLDELKALQAMASDYLALDSDRLDQTVQFGKLTEVDYVYDKT
ncbi:MAG: type II toxin-antitoxin system RelE/ParE family toxin [Proteobacteria bacterium]|nr:type II toxin-antitoxin system RelE/ParE family toxin [Pseudomonadota bacterium]MCL2308056.1 type II toxin-antitoxin system RelE/ParE family toxin [Pseudomonadota bacterium]